VLSDSRINDVSSLLILRHRGIFKLQLGANNHRWLLWRRARSSSTSRAEGFWALAMSLQGNKSFNRLDLHFNRIDPTDSEMLCNLIYETGIRKFCLIRFLAEGSSRTRSFASWI
jgi:hypothetical protein